MAVAITKKCGYWATNLKFTREGSTITASWELPAGATNTNNCARAEWQDMAMYQHKTQDLSSAIVKTTQKTKRALTVKSFTAQLAASARSIQCVVQLANSKGYHTSACSIPFDAPYQPSIGDITFDKTDTGKISCTVTTKAALLKRPRSDMQVQVWRTAVVNGKCVKNGEKLRDGGTIGWDTNDTVSWTYNLTGALPASLQPVKMDDFVSYTVQAQTLSPLGLHSGFIQKKLFIAYPAVPTISQITYVTGGANIVIKDNYTDKRPTQKLQVQIAYKDEQSRIEDSDWQAIGEEYTRPCGGIFISDEDITPEVGQHVFIRVKALAWDFPAYSAISKLDDKRYFTSEAGDDTAPTSTVQVTSVTPGDDNQSLNVVIGYPTTTAYNACEVSYSTDRYAWKSTNEPTSYEMRDTYWKDSTSQSSAHANTSSIKIAELDEGTTYFVRARRYNLTNTDSKSLWSQIANGNTTYSDIEGVALTSSDIVATGKDCVFSWSLEENLQQKSWALKQGSQVLESGTGSITSCTHAFDTAGDKSVYVQCTFQNGKSAKSDTVVVSVVDAPVLSFASTPATSVASLPYAFTVNADKTDAEIQVNILNKNGIVQPTPAGTLTQYADDVVWHSEGTGSLACSVNDGSALWNGGLYTIYAVATANGVKSDPLTADFTVAYTDTVSAPEDASVVITPTEDKGVIIQVNDLASGLTWDLYRATNDERNFLIAQDLSSGDIVTDPYAPYATSGNCSYLVLVKNAQRQFDYRSYDYSANYKTLRFDWANNYVELPYNIEISDESDKQFEQQVYLDGTQRGAWGASVVRTASLSTDTIYLKDEETIRKVRNLARYQGAVFVRTPLGQAYTANVEVNDITKTYDSKAVAVSFNVTEIDLTSEFSATPIEDTTA